MPFTAHDLVFSFSEMTCRMHNRAKTMVPAGRVVRDRRRPHGRHQDEGAVLSADDDSLRLQPGHPDPSQGPSPTGSWSCTSARWRRKERRKRSSAPPGTPTPWRCWPRTRSPIPRSAVHVRDWSSPGTCLRPSTRLPVADSIRGARSRSRLVRRSRRHSRPSGTASGRLPFRRSTGRQDAGACATPVRFRERLTGSRGNHSLRPAGKGRLESTVAEQARRLLDRLRSILGSADERSTR